MGHRVGIDIGGTFTDVVLLRDNGRFHVYKEDSTPDQPLLAITRASAGWPRKPGPRSQSFCVRRNFWSMVRPWRPMP